MCICNLYAFANYKICTVYGYGYRLKVLEPSQKEGEHPQYLITHCFIESVLELFDTFKYMYMCTCMHVLYVNFYLFMCNDTFNVHVDESC